MLSRVTLVLLVASVGLNVFQAQRIAKYKPGAVQPVAGTVIPALDLQTLDGRPVRLDFTNQPTILYYFSPKCGWCEKNWRNIKALAAGTERRYRFAAISSVADVKTFALERQLPFDVYTGLTPDAAKTLHFSGTPHTVIVSSRGTVEWAWAGAYTRTNQPDIEQRFGIVLPGIEVPSLNPQ